MGTAPKLRRCNENWTYQLPVSASGTPVLAPRLWFFIALCQNDAHRSAYCAQVHVVAHPSLPFLLKARKGWKREVLAVYLTYTSRLVLEMVWQVCSTTGKEWWCAYGCIDKCTRYNRAWLQVWEYMAHILRYWVIVYCILVLVHCTIHVQCFVVAFWFHKV